MNWRYRTRSLRRRLGVALAVLGMIVWAVSATLHFDGQDGRDVSMPHLEARTLGVIAGGAAVVAGIILFATAV